MGVHNLETFIKQEVPNGFVEVNVMAKVIDFKRIFKTRPILIFDVMSIVSYICERYKIEILCGGCFDFYQFHLEQLFSALQKSCDLFFFLDGFVQMDSKFNTWQKRQNDKYRESMTVIDEINHNKTVDQISRKHGKIYVNTMLNVIESVAIKFGTLKYAVNAECDQEIAQFAANNWRTLAVFSDDTDFLIFGGSWRYFSMKHLNSTTYITMEYSRAALKSFLALTDFQMSIYATCLGNDIICYRSLKSFHNKFNNKALEIAKFIREEINMKTHSEALDFLVKVIFGADNNYYKELLNTSINSYSINRNGTKQEGPFDYLLQYHMLFTRNVLSDAPFNYSLVFYDLIEYPKSYYDISIELLERQAGIVFAQTLVDPFPLKIYSKKSHKEPYQLYEAIPIMPPFEVMPMTAIHSKDELYDEHRMTLLAWTVCWEKLSRFKLQQVPARFMMDVLTLTYLVQNSLISGKEADIILYSVKRTEQKEAFARPPLRLDPRAFHVAFLYTRMYANIQRSIEVCGLNDKYKKPLNFNGIDFHNLYNFFKDKEFDPKTYLGNID